MKAVMLVRVPLGGRSLGQRSHDRGHAGGGIGSHGQLAFELTVGNAAGQNPTLRRTLSVATRYSDPAGFGH